MWSIITDPTVSSNQVSEVKSVEMTQIHHFGPWGPLGGGGSTISPTQVVAVSSRATLVVLVSGLALSRLTQGSILMIHILGSTNLDLKSCVR